MSETRNRCGCGVRSRRDLWTELPEQSVLLQVTLMGRRTESLMSAKIRRTNLLIDDRDKDRDSLFQVYLRGSEDGVRS